MNRVLFPGIMACVYSYAYDSFSNTWLYYPYNQSLDRIPVSVGCNLGLLHCRIFYADPKE